MSHPLCLRRVGLALLLTGTLAVGCGDRAEAEPIEIGAGGLPSTMPRDFPIPPDAVIGSTLIDRVNHRTEVTVTMQQEMVPVVQYFQVGLVDAGYVVNRSEGDRSHWAIEFVKGELRGTIDIDYDAGVAVALIAVNTA